MEAPLTSAKPNQIPGLNGWRGLAILLVLISHGPFNAHLASIKWVEFFNHFPRGEDGVRIFFCLSGFLITHLLLREEQQTGGISLGHFYFRRALRILPVYFGYILVIASLNGWLEWGLRWQNFIPPATFSTGLWLRRYNTWVFEHFWTLTVEEIFYLIWPLTLVLLPRAFRLPSAGLLLVIFPLGRMLAVGNSGAYWLGFGILMNFDFLMMGCLAALLYDPLKNWLAGRPAGIPSGLQWGGIALFLSVWAAQRHAAGWNLVGQTAEILSVGLVITLSALGLSLAIAATSLAPASLLTRFLEWRPLAGLGKISYSVYIWQQVILNPSIDNAPAWRMFPSNLFLAIGAGWLSYHLFEKRFLRLKRHFATPTPIR